MATFVSVAISTHISRSAQMIEGIAMSLEKYVEFDAAQRTYRIKVRLNNTYDIHGLNALMQQVGIYDDLNSGEKLL
ncbi:hypothetical protein [Paractinoplanes durhamensis]|uniref:hypothetical protein n=1 Tax=Paractinoplanes durhamensis TaxID=113563 RepID=UPI00362FC080